LKLVISAFIIPHVKGTLCLEIFLSKTLNFGKRKKQGKHTYSMPTLPGCFDQFSEAVSPVAPILPTSGTTAVSVVAAPVIVPSPLVIVAIPPVIASSPPAIVAIPPIVTVSATVTYAPVHAPVDAGSPVTRKKVPAIVSAHLGCANSVVIPPAVITALCVDLTGADYH
jgi:hypothetical protein